jgi:hypothetical protein
MMNTQTQKEKNPRERKEKSCRYVYDRKEKSPSYTYDRKERKKKSNNCSPYVIIWRRTSIMTSSRMM